MTKQNERAKLDRAITRAHDKIAAASAARRAAQDREQAAFRELCEAERAMRDFDFPQMANRRKPTRRKPVQHEK